MYIKIHNNRDLWFRDDGTLVGKEIQNTDSHFNYQQRIIKTDDNRYVKAIFGYLDSNNFFVIISVPSINLTTLIFFNFCFNNSNTSG